jgi:hypothetical protein
MRVETDKGVHLLWFSAVAGLGFMFLFLLIGVAGPQADASDPQFAHNCYNNTNPSETICPGGVNMTNGQMFVSTVERIDPLYEYVAIQV